MTNDGTLKQLTDSVESLQELARWIGGDREKDDTRALAEYYGVDEADYYGALDEFIGPDHEQIVLEKINEAVLCIDTKITKSIVFGIGGPHTEIEITLTADLEPLGGRAVGYWGGDKVERRISSDDVETLAEHFGLTERNQRGNR